MADIYDIESQTRIAFGKVKGDVAALREALELAQGRLDSLQLTFSHFTDKTEFYQFIESLRGELDRLEGRMASRKDLIALQEQVKELFAALESRTRRIEALEKELERRATKEELKRLDESRQDKERELSRSIADLTERLASKSQLAKVEERLDILYKRAAEQASLVKLEEQLAAQVAKLSKRLDALQDFKDNKASRDELKVLRADLQSQLDKSSSFLRQVRKDTASREEFLKADKDTARWIETLERKVQAGKESGRADVLKVSESQSLLGKELSSRIASLEQHAAKLRDDVRELKGDLRRKEAQIERLKARPASRRPVPALPKVSKKQVLIGLAVLVGIILLAIIIPAVPKYLASLNQTEGVVSDTQNDQCIADFECREVSPGNYYAHCVYDPTFENCRCEIAQSIDQCNAALKAEVASRSQGSQTSALGPLLTVFVVLLLVFGLLWIAGRRAKKE